MRTRSGAAPTSRAVTRPIRSSFARRKCSKGGKAKKSVRFNVVLQFTPSEETLYRQCVARCKKEGFNLSGLQRDIRLKSHSCEDVIRNSHTIDCTNVINSENKDWHSVACLAPPSSPTKQQNMLYTPPTTVKGLSNISCFQKPACTCLRDSRYLPSCSFSVSALSVRSKKGNTRKPCGFKSKRGISYRHRTPTPRWVTHPAVSNPSTSEAASTSINTQNRTRHKSDQQEQSSLRQMPLENSTLIPVDVLSESIQDMQISPNTGRIYSMDNAFSLYQDNSKAPCTTARVHLCQQRGEWDESIVTDSQMNCACSFENDANNNSLGDKSYREEPKKPGEEKNNVVKQPTKSSQERTVQCENDDLQGEERHMTEHQQPNSTAANDVNPTRSSSEPEPYLLEEIDEMDIPPLTHEDTEPIVQALISLIGERLDLPEGVEGLIDEDFWNSICQRVSSNSLTEDTSSTTHNCMTSFTSATTEGTGSTFDATKSHTTLKAMSHTNNDNHDITNHLHMKDSCLARLCDHNQSSLTTSRIPISADENSLGEAKHAQSSTSSNFIPTPSTSVSAKCAPATFSTSTATNSRWRHSSQELVVEDSNCLNTLINSKPTALIEEHNESMKGLEAVLEYTDNLRADGSLYLCPVLGCGLQFSNIPLLEIHLNQMKHSPCNPMSSFVNGTQPSSSSFLCPTCGCNYQDEESCLEHMFEKKHSRLMSPVPSLVYACPECLRFFQTSSDASRHMNDLSHYGYAFYFPDDAKETKIAEPIAVPERLSTELVERCSRVTHSLVCQECGEGLLTTDELCKHLDQRHVVAAKCCTSMRDVFSDLLTDQACAECGQFIYQGLPRNGLGVHTGCAMQGPILAWPARTLREFVLRCGIAPLNIGTELTLDCMGRRVGVQCQDSPLPTANAGTSSASRCVQPRRCVSETGNIVTGNDQTPNLEMELNDSEKDRNRPTSEKDDSCRSGESVGSGQISTDTGTKLKTPTKMYNHEANDVASTSQDLCSLGFSREQHSPLLDGYTDDSCEKRLFERVSQMCCDSDSVSSSGSDYSLCSSADSSCSFTSVDDTGDDDSEEKCTESMEMDNSVPNHSLSISEIAAPTKYVNSKTSVVTDKSQSGQIATANTIHQSKRCSNIKADDSVSEYSIAKPQTSANSVKSAVRQGQFVFGMNASLDTHLYGPSTRFKASCSKFREQGTQVEELNECCAGLNMKTISNFRKFDSKLEAVSRLTKNVIHPSKTILISSVASKAANVKKSKSVKRKQIHKTSRMVMNLKKKKKTEHKRRTLRQVRYVAIHNLSPVLLPTNCNAQTFGNNSGSTSTKGWANHATLIKANKLVRKKRKAIRASQKRKIIRKRYGCKKCKTNCSRQKVFSGNRSPFRNQSYLDLNAAVTNTCLEESIIETDRWYIPKPLSSVNIRVSSPEHVESVYMLVDDVKWVPANTSTKKIVTGNLKQTNSMMGIQNDNETCCLYKPIDSFNGSIGDSNVCKLTPLSNPGQIRDELAHDTSNISYPSSSNMANITDTTSMHANDQNDVHLDESRYKIVNNYRTREPSNIHKVSEKETKTSEPRVHEFQNGQALDSTGSWPIVKHEIRRSCSAEIFLPSTSKQASSAQTVLFKPTTKLSNLKQAPSNVSGYCSDSIAELRIDGGFPLRSPFVLPKYARLSSINQRPYKRMTDDVGTSSNENNDECLEDCIESICHSFDENDRFVPINSELNRDRCQSTNNDAVVEICVENEEIENSKSQNTSDNKYDINAKHTPTIGSLAGESKFGHSSKTKVHMFPNISEHSNEDDIRYAKVTATKMTPCSGETRGEIVNAYIPSLMSLKTKPTNANLFRDMNKTGNIQRKPKPSKAVLRNGKYVPKQKLKTSVKRKCGASKHKFKRVNVKQPYKKKLPKTIRKKWQSKKQHISLRNSTLKERRTRQTTKQCTKKQLSPKYKTDLKGQPDNRNKVPKIKAVTNHGNTISANKSKNYILYRLNSKCKDSNEKSLIGHSDTNHNKCRNKRGSTKLTYTSKTNKTQKYENCISPTMKMSVPENHTEKVSSLTKATNPNACSMTSEHVSTCINTPTNKVSPQPKTKRNKRNTATVSDERHTYIPVTGLQTSHLPKPLNSLAENKTDSGKIGSTNVNETDENEPSSPIDTNKTPASLESKLHATKKSSVALAIKNSSIIKTSTTTTAKSSTLSKVSTSVKSNDKPQSCASSQVVISIDNKVSSTNLHGSQSNTTKNSSMKNNLSSVEEIDTFKATTNNLNNKPKPENAVKFYTTDLLLASSSSSVSKKSTLNTTTTQAPPQLARSLLLSLDGPSSSRMSVLSRSSTTSTTVCTTKSSSRQCHVSQMTKKHEANRRQQSSRLKTPKIQHLSSMTSIVFADLENFMFFKHFQGQLPPLTFVWGFVCARPCQPFHREKYFRKYDLYRSLKSNRCTHVSTEIGFGKDAVDFAMTLAIAKLDDRLPVNIPFFIVSNDGGFREIENQMRRARRRVKVIAPRKHRLTVASLM